MLFCNKKHMLRQQQQRRMGLHKGKAKPQNGQKDQIFTPRPHSVRPLHRDKGSCHSILHPLWNLLQCHCIFGILLVLALAIVLVGRTLNVTLALKPLQKVLFELPLGRVFAGFFDTCKVLVVLAIALFSQSSEILLTTATICVGILEDVTVGRSPTIDLVSVLFQCFRKEDL